MVFRIIHSIDTHFKKQKIKKTARYVAERLLLSPNDAQLYLTKATNLAWQARMLLMDRPVVQKPPPTGDFSVDLANAFLATHDATREHYDHIASLLAQSAEAAYLALQLTQKALPTPPVKYYWENWRQQAMMRCHEALTASYMSQDAYTKALRWLVGVLSENPLDAEICYWAALLLLSGRRYDDAILFFLVVFAFTEREKKQAPAEMYKQGLLAAEKVREKQSAAYLLRGNIFLLRQEYAEAAAELKRVPEVEQEKTSLFCWISYRQRAKALEAAGHVAEAADLLRKAEELLQQRNIR